MKRMLFRVTILGVSVILTLCLVEGALAFANLPSAESVLGMNKKVFSCYRPDHTTIYQTIPGNTLCPSEEINEEGFRIHPGAQSTRESVVLLGDSFIFGNYVDAGHTVPAYIQQSLNTQGVTINVINAGIPGFGTDQQYVQFVKNVLPRTTPKTLLWAVHENDWEAHDYGCLIPQTGNPRIMSAYRNTLYWRATIAPHLPLIVIESKIYNLIMRVVPENFTVGCTSMKPLTIMQQNEKKEKIFTAMKSLAEQEKFTLHFIYVQSQHAYSAHPPSGYEEETRQKLSVFADMNESPLVVSETVKRLLSEEMPGNANARGKLDEALFVLDDPSGYGGQHMNEEGNRLFATVLYPLVHRK